MTYMYVESQNWILPGGPFETRNLSLELVDRLARLSWLRLLLTGSRSVSRQAVCILCLRGSQVLVWELLVVHRAVSFNRLGCLCMCVTLRDRAGSTRPSEAVVGGSETSIIVASPEAIARDLRREGGRRRWCLAGYRAESRAICLRRSGRGVSPGRSSRRKVGIVNGSAVIHGYVCGRGSKDDVDRGAQLRMTLLGRALGTCRVRLGWRGKVVAIGGPIVARQTAAERAGCQIKASSPQAGCIGDR